MQLWGFAPQSRPTRLIDVRVVVKLDSPAVVLVPWLLTESPSLSSMNAGFDRAEPDVRKWYGPGGAGGLVGVCKTMPGGGNAMLVRASQASDPSPESTESTLESAELSRARLYRAVGSPHAPGGWAGIVLTCTTGSHPPPPESPVPWLFWVMEKSCDSMTCSVVVVARSSGRLGRPLMTTTRWPSSGTGADRGAPAPRCRPSWWRYRSRMRLADAFFGAGLKGLMASIRFGFVLVISRCVSDVCGGGEG